MINDQDHCGGPSPLSRPRSAHRGPPVSGGTAPALLRVSEAAEMLGVSRSTLYNMLRDGTFCAPIRIGSRAVRFVRAEVAAWIDAKASARRSPVD